MRELRILSVLAMAASMAFACYAQRLSGCPMFPADNIWNTSIDTLPVHPNSAAFVNTIGASKPLHPDFGAALWRGSPGGIPFTTVPPAQPKVPVFFVHPEESDPGPYPFPPNAPIEATTVKTSDRHVVVLDAGTCKLYETFYSFWQKNGSWKVDTGAIFDMKSNALRPDGWTSADAAGLPILPGLARYDEVASGKIAHALRFTAPETLDAYVWPGRHRASKLRGAQYPPLGLRFRLKADYDISTFTEDTKVILRALKKYGMILADNGSSWYISGAPDARWNDSNLHRLRLISGSAFEAVDESSLMVSPDSAQAKPVAGAKR
jgi:hypothetical protein